MSCQIHESRRLRLQALVTWRHILHLPSPRHAPFRLMTSSTVMNVMMMMMMMLCRAPCLPDSSCVPRSTYKSYNKHPCSLSVHVYIRTVVERTRIHAITKVMGRPADGRVWVNSVNSGTAVRLIEPRSRPSSVVSRRWPLDRKSTTRTDHVSAPPSCHRRLRPFNYRPPCRGQVPTARWLGARL